MRLVRNTIILVTIALATACGEAAKEISPVDTLKKYTEAVMKKDTTQMKLLLSDATLKIHTDQAKAQKVTLDEIVSRETLFPPDQRTFAYRNEKIENDKATVEVKNNFGGWDMIFLVKENGAWKIDKKGTAQQMIQQSDTDVQNLDQQMDAERKKTEELLNQTEGTDPAGSPEAKPTWSPLPNPDEPADPTADTPGSPPPAVAPPPKP